LKLLKLLNNGYSVVVPTIAFPTSVK